MPEWPIRGRRLLSIAALALFGLASPAAGQAGFGHLEDATAPPKGLLRLRAATVWTRFDARFAATGTTPLGGIFSADSLGSATFPSLAPIETRIQSAAGAPFTLSLGRSRVDATAREEVVPLTLEYGITNRLSVGVMAPLVRRRVMVQFRLDTAGGFVANVGPNAHRTSPAVATTNAQVQSQFSNAVTQLQSRLNSCQANPTGPGCPALLARQAEALQLIQSSQAFASDLGILYGTATTTGSAFVPTTQSAAQAAIAARISTFNAQYQDLLNTTANLLTQTPTGAGGPAGVSEFQRYLTEELGRDSIANRERVLVGDVEIGVKFRALDLPRTATRTLGLQLALAGGVRLATGSRQSPTELADLSTGGGMIVADTRGILDARVGRLGLFAAAAFATSVRAVDTVNLQSRDERWTEIHLAPRWHFSEPFSAHAAYSLRSADKTGSDQMVGGGLSFTTVSSWAGGRLPLEMRFTHLQAISGDAGRPKFFRDQLELRLYYRLLKP